MGLLIHNVTIFTNDEQNTILEDYAVAVEGSRITAVSPTPELKSKYPDFEQIDGGGRLLMPGFVNTHMP